MDEHVPRVHHRGATNDIAAYAIKFIEGRLEGFEKDMKICLTPAKSASTVTHAYLPALAACCGTLEYLAGLRHGNVLTALGEQQIAAFALDYLPQPDFDREAVRILFRVFRHPIAHRGIASGVWVDPKLDTGGRRLTWQVSADAKRPACEVVKRAGVLKQDPPWDCSYTHRGHIHLRRFWVDLRVAASKYGKALADSEDLQAKFRRCMEQLYPV